jgi:hypothetical protein
MMKKLLIAASFLTALLTGVAVNARADETDHIHKLAEFYCSKLMTIDGAVSCIVKGWGIQLVVGFDESQAQINWLCNDLLDTIKLHSNPQFFTMLVTSNTTDTTAFCFLRTAS